jgi:hypothetical protein
VSNLPALVRRLGRDDVFTHNQRRTDDAFHAAGQGRQELRGGNHADKNSEAGIMPSEELLTEMGKFNEELVKAGVMLAGEGLHPSSKGARVRFSGSERSVIDGPFTEAKELVAGYWLIEVKSMEEAIEWVKRVPNPMDGESEIEIRQVLEADDFCEEYTPETRERDDRLRTEIEDR